MGGIRPWFNVIWDGGGLELYGGVYSPCDSVECSLGDRLDLGDGEGPLERAVFLRVEMV